MGNKVISTPVEIVFTPVKTISTAVKPDFAPVKTISTSVEGVPTPVKSISTPVKMIFTPVETDSTPVKMSEMVKETTSTVMETTRFQEIIGCLIQIRWTIGRSMVRSTMTLWLHLKKNSSRVNENPDSSALGFRAFTSSATGTATGAEEFFAMRKFAREVCFRQPVSNG